MYKMYTGNCILSSEKNYIPKLKWEMVFDPVHFNKSLMSFFPLICKKATFFEL